MKRVVVVALISAAMSGSPAAAQSSGVYICTASGSNETFRVAIGPNEYRMNPNAQNDLNFCQRYGNIEGMDCGFQGSTFVASLNGRTEFSLDTGNGAYFLAADGLFSEEDERGTCRAG